MASGCSVCRRFADVRRPSEMVQLPQSTSMATYSPWWSASTADDVPVVHLVVEPGSFFARAASTGHGRLCLCLREVL